MQQILESAMLRVLPTLFLFFSFCASNPQEVDPGGVESAQVTRQHLLLERILNQSIIPFWTATVDHENGGFHTGFDSQSKRLSTAPKTLITQARILWFFSKLHNSPYRTGTSLELASHSYKFLRDRMWDKDFGGFFWEIDQTGKQQLLPNKHLYAQSFGLYALSEYYIASKNQEALQLANELFELIDGHGHDAEHGGYLEYFTQDWNLEGRPAISYMGHPSEMKLMNTHLHLMEAFTSYSGASGNEVALERLRELVIIQGNTVVRKELGACTDKYEVDWTAVKDPQYDRVSYGHDLENIWLHADALSVLKIPRSTYMDLYRSLFSYSLRWGFDREEGGFYYTGPFRGLSDDRDKIWWTEAESMLSALSMYEFTGDPEYYAIFSKTLEWISNYQVDWDNGGWHNAVREDGTVHGPKASSWKGPYHDGRAVLMSLEKLDRIKQGIQQ
jgi:mannobiose 2-epimerase